MSKIYYKGFSTKNWLKNKSFSLHNIELVNENILNHIYTRLGERLGQPSFGTRIPEMAFEPNDPTTISLIQTDIETVVNFDPRVNLISISTLPLTDNNALIFIVNLFYVEFHVSGNLNIEVKSGTLWFLKRKKYGN